MTDSLKTKYFSSSNEQKRREDFRDLFQNSPIPKAETLSNLGLFLNRQTLSRILFMHELYQKIINVNGVIMEFGVRWGQNLALFESFRGIYEPFNYTRKIIGFDTFEGFPSVHEKDGGSEIIQVGAYSVTKGYEDYLSDVLQYHEQESPIPHIKKYDLIKGDATVTVPNYLIQHPETIIAFAYFDFDIYEPTKVCLEAIKPHITKGTVIAFDELNHPDYPGETLAVKEALGINNYKIIRTPLTPYISYLVIE
jgi:hypothetical protein